MKSLAFHNKTVLITGSGSGIGKATAIEFCRQGARVMLNGRDKDKLEKTRQSLAEIGYSVAACTADVTDYAACEHLLRATLETFGSLDVVVANAGVSMQALFGTMRPEIFRQVVESMIIGPAFTARASLNAISASKGSIVFIGSVAGFIGLPAVSAYSAGKMALTALTESLQAESVGSDVHFGIVYVGFTQNDPDKKVLAADGSKKPVAERSKKLQQTQAHVARAIVKLTLERKFRIVLSPLGNLTVWLNRFFPGVARWIVRANAPNFIQNLPKA